MCDGVLFTASAIGSKPAFLRTGSGRFKTEPLIAAGTEQSRAEQQAERPAFGSRLAGSAVPPRQQASRGRATELHAQATLGNEGRLSGALSRVAGAAVDQGDQRQWTAFHCACAAGHTACTSLLPPHATLSPQTVIVERPESNGLHHMLHTN